MYLVQAMQPKDGATFDNCSKVCPKDLVAGGRADGDFIGSVLLKPEGVEETKDGVKKIEPFHPVLRLQVNIDRERTPLSGRAAYNNCIAHHDSLIACNVAIQDAKPASERNYNIDIGFRLRLEIKDITGGNKKTITETKVLVYEN